MDDERSGRQEEELERVSLRISASILAFYQERGLESFFRADDLREWVSQEVGPIAPGSADRIMRDLRQKRLINYKVVSRSESLYQIKPIRPERPPGVQVEFDFE
jgi:hypothetical protein